MADGTKAGGDAPRTLFSLGRSGKRKGRVAETSPLEDYPPQHADDAVADDDVSPLAAIEGTDIEAAHAELLRDDAGGATEADTSDLDSIVEDSDEPDPQACPSCSEPLVAGAMFCGECGTRVVSDDASPAAVLLDDEVPGEPLPPEPEGVFEVAEPVTGSFEDDELLDADDLAEDDDTHIEEQAVFGAFIAADDLAEADTEVEAEADTAVEAEDDAEVEAEDGAEVETEGEEDTEVEAEDDAEVVAEGEADAEVEAEEDTDVEAEDDTEVEADADVDPESELVEETEVAETEVAEAEVAEAEVAEAEVAEAEVAEDGSDSVAPAVPIAAASTAEAAEGSAGGGSKKGVWIGVAAAAAAIVLIVGVVAMGSGGKGEAKKDDQVASGTQKSTTTTVASSTTASPTSTEAPATTDTSAPVTTDTSVAPSTNTTSAPSTNTTGRPVVPPPTSVQASPPNVQVSCPPQSLAPGRSYNMGIKNLGGTATSFLVTWSALKTGVTVSPTTGTVGPNSQANVTVNVANGTPGSASRVIIKWSGGSTSCNLLVQ